jgi:transposase
MKSFSFDLRIRVVLNYLNITNSCRKTASIFSISKSTVSRWYILYKSNNLLPKKRNIKKNKVNDNIIQFIKSLIIDNNFITIKIIKYNILKKYNLNLSFSHIHNIIKKIKFSRKRIHKKIYNPKNDLEQCKKIFFNKIKENNIKNIISIDETGFNLGSSLNYGRTLKGTRCIKNINCNINNKKINSIFSINMNGNINYQLYDNKNINSYIFYDYCFKHLSNYKNKIFLMDNVGFHKTKKVIDILTKNNNKIIFTPAYSPDTNPIEFMFSKLKHIIKSNYHKSKKEFLAINQITKKKISKKYYNYSLNTK